MFYIDKTTRVCISLSREVIYLRDENADLKRKLAIATVGVDQIVEKLYLLEENIERIEDGHPEVTVVS